MGSFWANRKASAGVLERMRFIAGVAMVLVFACTSADTVRTPNTTTSPAAATAQAPVANVPPAGADTMQGGCGVTEIYSGGMLPDWASVNAPKTTPYVVATPGVAVGYIFSYPLKAGLDANTKVLWYVGRPRGGLPLNVEGHPSGAVEPIVKFTKAADSFPGEIYPTGPIVPTAGCWRFTLTWHGGDEHADVDLLFK
jgi:hypothetical protein